MGSRRTGGAATFFEKDPKITAFSAGGVNPDASTNAISTIDNALAFGAQDPNLQATTSPDFLEGSQFGRFLNKQDPSTVETTPAPSFVRTDDPNQRVLDKLTTEGFKSKTDSPIESFLAATDRSQLDPSFGEAAPPGIPPTGPEDVLDVPDQAPGDVTPKDGEKEGFDLAGAAADALEKFITGETPDRFARQSRDQFTKFAAAQTDALQAENERLILSGQISAAEGAARIDNFMRGLVGERGQLETTITENKERTIKENIGEVSKFLESQVRIDNITNTIESRQLNDVIKAVSKGVLTPEAGRILLVEQLPLLASKGIIDPATGEIDDRFKSASGFEILKTELLEAGVSDAEATAFAKMMIVIPALTMKAMFTTSVIDQVEAGILTPRQAFDQVKPFEPTLTFEEFEGRLADIEQRGEEGELDISFEVAVSNPFGGEADKLIAGEGRTDDNAEAFDKNLQDVVNERVKDIIAGETTASIDKKDASDPVYKALLGKASDVGTVFPESSFVTTGRNRFEFGSVVKNGTFIKVGDKLFKVTSDVKNEKDVFPDPRGSNIFGVIERVDSQFVEVLDVTTGQTSKVYAAEFKK